MFQITNLDKELNIGQQNIYVSIPCIGVSNFYSGKNMRITLINYINSNYTLHQFAITENTTVKVNNEITEIATFIKQFLIAAKNHVFIAILNNDNKIMQLLHESEYTADNKFNLSDINKIHTVFGFRVFEISPNLSKYININETVLDLDIQENRNMSFTFDNTWKRNVSYSKHLMQLLYNIIILTLM